MIVIAAEFFVETHHGRVETEIEHAVKQSLYAPGITAFRLQDVLDFARVLPFSLTRELLSFLHEFAYVPNETITHPYHTLTPSLPAPRQTPA